MSKFKVGDQIVGTSGLTELGMYEGKPYTVKECSASRMTLEECFCKATGHYFTFTPSNYDLYEASTPEPAVTKFNKGDKVKCVSKTSAIGVEVGGIYTIINPQHHYGTYYGKKHNHVGLEEVQSTPNEDCLELYVEEIKQPTSYREMNPDSTVKIGDYESEVCLGDLVHATALLGVTNGCYGADLWKFLKNTLGEYSFEEDIDTIIEFREKQKQSLEYFFKPFYGKQNEKDVLLKDIEEQKTILKNQQEFLKELEDKHNSL